MVSAVAKVRADGEEDLLTLFISGARAYFGGSWEHRDVARLFMTGDGPPGFEMMRRARSHEMGPAERGAARGLRDSVDRMTVAVLTTIIGVRRPGKSRPVPPARRPTSWPTPPSLSSGAWIA